MQLIPSLVLQHLANPAQTQKLFVEYIQKAGLNISNSKTIAGVGYFHKKQFPLGQLGTQFFSGTFASTATNVPGNSFIRPESEHFLIWGIRVETQVNQLLTAVWVPGVGTSAWMYNTIMTLTTNSEVKLKKFPLSEALDNLTVRDNGLIPLAEPIFWGGQQDLVIDVVNCEDVIAPDKQFMKITLIGLALI